MSVKYMLNRIGRKRGLNAADPEQRLTMLYDINEAARELYDQSDPPNCLMEQIFKVNGDQTITCPAYVGEVRAARELDSQVAWSINQMRPRYNQFNWTDMWRNLRLKNASPIQKSITNESVMTLTTTLVENPVVIVTITGTTLNSTNTTESITMDAVSKQTINQFLDITSITKNVINQYDIQVLDVDNVLISTIPNNQFEAYYQIIDVSSCPWLAISTSTLDHYLEILFKKALPILWNDSDEYPALKYDDIIVNKVMQLWGEEQGKPDIAMAYDEKATRSLARKTENQNRPTEDVIALVANPHDVLLPRIRQGRRKYYRGYGSRGYGY